MLGLAPRIHKGALMRTRRRDLESFLAFFEKRIGQIERWRLSGIGGIVKQGDGIGIIELMAT